MTTAEAWADYELRNTLARRAYDDLRFEQDAPAPTGPKTTRTVGTGVGICDRCGIDSQRLVGEKCPPCYAYLARKNSTATDRTCTECAETFTGRGYTCGRCRGRKHRANAGPATAARRAAYQREWRKRKKETT